MSYVQILFVLGVVLCSTLSARILGLFPIPSISHQVVFRAITTELVRKGHEVTVLTPNPVYQKGEGPANLIEIDVHDLSYGLWREKILPYVNGANSLEIMEKVSEATVDMFEMQINSEAFKEAMKNNTGFDLILSEACMTISLVFSNIYKVPVVQVSSFGATQKNLKSFGIPTHPIIYPDFFARRLFNLTVWDKIRDLNNLISSWYLFDDRYENEMLKRNFGANVPSTSDLSRNPDLLILNLHSMLSFNRPVPPGVIQVSGLHLKPKKDLPMDLKSLLDNSKHGVIYMSFGTNFNISAALPEKIVKFNNVFATLPYDVIWKWDADVMTGKAHNVKLMKWVPQADLLHHPKVKAFITQAGLQSTDETIDAAVPIIAFPTSADQWYNAEQLAYYEIGIQLDLLSFTEDQLYDAVMNVIKDDRYRRNVRKLSNLFKDTPDTALNTAVWWIEYVIRHGGAQHLRSRAADASWSEYLMLDVVFSVLATQAVCLLIVAFAIRYVIRRNRKNKQKSM